MNMISAAQMYATKKGMVDERIEGVSMLLIASQLESVKGSKASWIGRLVRDRLKNESNMAEGCCDCPA